MVSELRNGKAPEGDLLVDVKLVGLSGVALVNAAPEPALDVARMITAECAGGCTSLFVVDCNQMTEWQTAYAMGWYLYDSSRGRMPNSLVLFREVQCLSRWNQTQLAELLANRRRGADSVRVAASSSIDLYEMVCEELFDASLYYLLNVVMLTPGGRRPHSRPSSDFKLGECLPGSRNA